MARRPTYTAKHVQEVERLVNAGLSKSDAIIAAGYTDPSLFYRQLRVNNVKQQIKYIFPPTPILKPDPDKPKHSFI